MAGRDLLCALLAVVTVSYCIASTRASPSLHSVPEATGHSTFSRPAKAFRCPSPKAGRTIFTIRASKAVQFKKGGHADLKNVHIVVYGKAHDRYDQIYGNEFTYDPQSGDVNAIGEVHIDLQGIRRRSR